jgi:hypothetical protein
VWKKTLLLSQMGVDYWWDVKRLLSTCVDENSALAHTCLRVGGKLQRTIADGIAIREFNGRARASELEDSCAGRGIVRGNVVSPVDAQSCKMRWSPRKAKLQYDQHTKCITG